MEKPKRRIVERRAHERHLKRINFIYRAKSSSEGGRLSRPVRGEIENIGLGGFAFRTSSMEVDGIHLSFNDDFSRNTILAEIFLPPPGKKITAECMVEWYERSLGEGGKEFTVGVSFIDMSDEDRRILRRYLAKETTSWNGIE